MALYIVSIFTDVENRNKSCPRMWFDSSGFPIYDTVIIPPITDMNFVISNIPLILKTSVSNHKLMALSPHVSFESLLTDRGLQLSEKLAGRGSPALTERIRGGSGALPGPFSPCGFWFQFGTRHSSGSISAQLTWRGCEGLINCMGWEF